MRRPILEFVLPQSNGHIVRRRGQHVRWVRGTAESSYGVSVLEHHRKRSPERAGCVGKGEVVTTTIAVGEAQHLVYGAPLPFAYKKGLPFSILDVCYSIKHRGLVCLAAAALLLQEES